MNPGPNPIKSSRRQDTPSGPVFDFGPGWGHKTKKWFKKYILGGKCTLCRATRYVFLLGIIILIFGGPQLRVFFDGHDNQKLTGQLIISEVIQSGDSKIKLARRALADYLTKLPDPTLTNGQKVYIETILGQEIDNDNFRAGNSIEFPTDHIKSIIEKSKLLTPSQLQRWDAAAKGVKF